MTAIGGVIDDFKLALAKLEAIAAGASPLPAIGGSELRIMKMAAKHDDVQRKKGSLTLGDSIVIRRAEYGANVKASANLFGKKGSNAILYRDVPPGTPRSDDQPVFLTLRGLILADEYRRLMGLPK